MRLRRGMVHHRLCNVTFVWRRRCHSLAVAPALFRTGIEHVATVSTGGHAAVPEAGLPLPSTCLAMHSPPTSLRSASNARGAASGMRATRDAARTTRDALTA